MGEHGIDLAISIWSSTMRGISSILVTAAVLTAQNSLDDGLRSFHRGSYAEAARILAAYPTEPIAQAFLAMSQAAQGDCVKAQPKLEQYFSNGTDADARRLTGLALTQCYLTRKNFGAATELVNKLQQSYPKDGDVLYEAAKVHMRAWNDAIVRMYENAPQSFRVNQLSAEVFETQGRFDEAISEYRKAIAKNSQAVNLHFRLGRALLLASHSEEALAAAQKEFEAELAINPSDAAAEYQVGQTLVARQKPADAATHFTKAISLSAEFPEALVALAKLHIEARNYAQAQQLLERALKIAPEMESAHYSLMLVYRNTGRTADAMREKAELDKLQKRPEGEFTEFLKKLNEQPAKP